MSRSLVFSILRYSGALAAWQWCHRDSIVVVMMHSVMDEGVPSTWVPLRAQLSRERLDRCLTELGKRYTFVSLDEVAEVLAGVRKPRPYSLALTLDDGYRNQFQLAAPILAKHGAPATIYIVPGHIDSREPFWYDRLDYALQSAAADDRGSAEETVRVAPERRGTLREEYRRLRERLRVESADDVAFNARMHELAADAEKSSGRALRTIIERDEWSALAQWSELDRIDASLVTVGSHTVDHVRLAHVEPAVAEDQLRRSKAQIEGHLGRPCVHFCYPDGSHNDVVADIVRACGYRTATTVEEGINPVGTDLMKIRRMNLPTEGSMTEMLANVSGLSHGISLAKAAVKRLVRARAAVRPRPLSTVNTEG